MKLGFHLLIASLVLLPVQLVAQIAGPPDLPTAPITELPAWILPVYTATSTLPSTDYPTRTIQITLGLEIEANLITTGPADLLFITRQSAEEVGLTPECVGLQFPYQLRPLNAIRKVPLRSSKYPPCGEKDKARPFVQVRYREYAPQPVDGSLDLTNLPQFGHFLLLEAGETCQPRPGDQEKHAQDYDDPIQRPTLCYYRTLLVNTGTTASPHWVEGFRATKEGLKIKSALFDTPSHLAFAINGTPVKKEMSSLTFGSRDISNYHVEVYEEASGCREYSLQYEDKDSPPESIDVDIPILKLTEDPANGIHVGAPKVYDSFLLRSKLNAAAQQLAAISPWNATAITNAYGTLQGVTRDVSYLAAQVTTAATPSIATTTNTGSTILPPSVIQSGQCPTGFAATGISSTGVTCTQLPTQVQIVGATAQCPSGYYVSSTSAASSVNTNGGPTGTSTTTPSIICSQIPGTGTPGTPPPNATLTTTNGTPQATQVVTTSPSLSPTVPTAPTANPFSAPTNLSVSAADMLAEQVQLNAQLQMYQMLLQGSQSDQFLLKNSRAVAARAQTTIGFQVSLSPPRQFKHAVAEVRVVIVPHPTTDRHFVPGTGNVSVVNLLPSQKTYNVAKITSNQKAFGAGAVIEQVNVGFSTGKSKDRLYLAKDTDTVALEYPNLTVPDLKPPFPERFAVETEEIVKEQYLHECPSTWEGDRNYLDNASIMFGWQFRPVLGAEYVSAGPREVFAQLALPTTLNEDGFAPAVYVQTRWREYNEKRQVVGPVFQSSCSWTRVQDAVSILNPLRVHNVTWDDVGNGTLKMVASGDFFASGMTVMTAGTNIPPTAFDGKTIQFFAPAHDLLQNGRIQLLGENGQTTDFAVSTKSKKESECGITEASLRAVPYPDGNSHVQLKLKYGEHYLERDAEGQELDGAIRPLLLIGNDVYGVQPKPFLKPVDPKINPCPPNNDHGATCTYEFVATTDSLRSAQTFLVRDPAWNFSRTSTIDIGPAFTSITSLSSATNDSAPGAGAIPPTQPTTADIVAAPAGAAPSSADYAVSGSGFRTFLHKTCVPAPVCVVEYYLYAYVDQASPLPLTSANFRILSDTTALLHLESAPKKSLKISWYPASGAYTITDNLPVAWDLSLPSDSGTSDRTAKATASPPFLYAGDSETVTFTADFSKVNIVNVTFEQTTVLLNGPLAKPKNLKVPVPVSVTKIPGHKQFVVNTLTTDGKATTGTVILDLDIVKR
ncbi:MAG TPA: hypothetical protein VGM18_11815 [Candidatus Sulfotelmatobacter sp.]|jgi:hypothetical protein